MEEQQQIRRRTSSDATWRARPKMISNEEQTGNDMGGYTNHQQRSDTFRTNYVRLAGDRTFPNHLQRTDANDNTWSRGQSRNSKQTVKISSNNYSRPSDTLVIEAKVFPVGDKIAAVTQTINDVIEAHLVTSVHTAESVRRGKFMCAAINKQHNNGCNENTMQLLTLSEPPEPKSIWKMFTGSMAATIRRVSIFASILPGFAGLTVEDQNQIFKHGSFEVILARYSQCFTSEGMLTPDMTTIVPRELINQMPLGDLFLEQFEFADVFNLLNLSDTELGLVCAVLLINSSRLTERCCFRQPLVVQKLQVRYLQALYIYLTRQHPADYDDMFIKILDVMPLSAAVNESHALKVHAMKETSMMNHSTESCNETAPFPDIHNEVFP